jgi:transketolase
MLTAQAKHLDNLVIIIDRNHFQANIRTEELIPLEPLEDKFNAFGANTKRIDGHNFEQMSEAFTSLPYSTAAPSVLIADTIRGKGLPSIEERADRWFVNFSHKEVEMLHKELHGAAMSELTSETLMVR